ncbi:SDR family NAD(P)-dependent oxidoreductase [Roseburia hominis]|uniref:SDR family NAD(P)-dependent oxidoreductase n=1 Tax=Roseburia hominis TaxID=301301 RepID=UPI001F2AD460|nr:SDR family NAD(P)-dependent oxidoreductase [Roseburia hominis]
MSKRIAIITGATGGIGREFTRLLVEEDIDEVWTVARNEKKLEEVKKLYGEKVIPLAKDLTHTEEICEIEEKIKRENAEVLYLVNNAGMAKMGSYQEFSIQELENTIDLNCKAPVILSNLCIPYMKKGSHILNISSASAFQPNPYINLYAASKAFERSYSRALNVEVENLGIIVTAVCPSWVDTEMLIKERNGKKVKFPGIVTAEAVAKQAMKDAKKGKDMSICSFYVKCQHVNVKLMPQKLTMKLWMHGLKKYL